MLDSEVVRIQRHPRKTNEDDDDDDDDDDEASTNQQEHRVLSKTYLIILTLATIATSHYASQESQQYHIIDSYPIDNTNSESSLISRDRLLFESVDNTVGYSNYDNDLMNASLFTPESYYDVPINETVKISSDREQSTPSLFPLKPSDYYGFIFAILGLMLAAGGGIGGGGILVPIYILIMGFTPKHAIALSNVTVVGGAIANNFINLPKRHPLVDRPLIDYDLVLIMIPLTLLGALIGAFFNKVLPEVLLTVLLVLLLSVTSYTTLKKAISMYQKESNEILKTKKENAINPNELLSLTLSSKYDDTTKSNNFKQSMSLHTEECSDDDENDSTTDDDEIVQIQQPRQEVFDEESHYGSIASTSSRTRHDLEKILNDERNIPIGKVLLLIFTFLVVITINILKGGGSTYASPIGIQCGSKSFWIVHLYLFVFILSIVIYLRHHLIQRYKQKQKCNYQYVKGDIQWNAQTTIYFPIICCFAGFFAGMFGIGGGIITGPLILALGVHPEVNSASSAFMILFTSLTATTSYLVFGLVIPDYAIMCLLIGIIATYVGHVSLYYYIRKLNRNSFIAFSIGLVVLISATLMTMQTILSMLSGHTGHARGMCS